MQSAAQHADRRDCHHASRVGLRAIIWHPVRILAKGHHAPQPITRHCWRTRRCHANPPGQHQKASLAATAICCSGGGCCSSCCSPGLLGNGGHCACATSATGRFTLPQLTAVTLKSTTERIRVTDGFQCGCGTCETPSAGPRGALGGKASSHGGCHHARGMAPAVDATLTKHVACPQAPVPLTAFSAPCCLLEGPASWLLASRKAPSSCSTAPDCCDGAMPGVSLTARDSRWIYLQTCPEIVPCCPEPQSMPQHAIGALQLSQSRHS